MATRDPHSFVDGRQGRIRHIDFDIHVDFERRVLRGRADYEIAGAVPGPMFLDMRDVVIREVRTGAGPMPWEVDARDPIKGQRLRLDNASGAERFSIAFETSPGATALGWLDPAHTAGGAHPFLLTQCQSIHARSIFPCQDSPGVRFTYSAVVDVPAPLRAVMSADCESVEARGDRVICRFRMPQAIPSYLFALAVGNLAYRDLGARSGIYAEPETVEAAAWEFADTERMIDEAEKLFGPYLWDRYNMLVLPPAFPYGGMENPRIVFLTPTLLVGNRSMVSVVVHELVHSWTGNLVTNETWEDFWLNEGWTVYAERRLLEVLEGKAYAELQAAVRRRHMLDDMRVFGMDANPTRLKYSQEGIDPDDVFSVIPYEKGATFLLCVEQAVGRERFDPFIRKYIETFRFRSIGTTEFLAFLRREFPDIDGRVDVERWVYGPGFPEDSPDFRSPLLDDVQARLAAFGAGERFGREAVAGWRPQQVEIFLKNLPPGLSAADCGHLEEVFDLKSTRVYNTLTEYYALGIRAGHAAVLPDVERLVASVGRMLFLKPVYRALAETEWSRLHARAFFEKYRGSYHPIAVKAVERVLEEFSV